MTDVGQISPFMRGMITRNKNGSITAPDNIIQSLPAAYNQYIAQRNDNLERIEKWSSIEGLVAGNPPYDQAELDENGLSHVANFNNFKARADYKKAAQGFWNLINSTASFVNISMAQGVGVPPDVQKYGNIMSRHLSDVIKEWEDFEPNFNLLGGQLVKFGICPVFYPHEESPIWEVVDVSRFFIPSQSQVFLSKLTNFSIETTYTCQQLYQIYKDDNAVNWNKDAIAELLLLRANAIKPQALPFQNMMELERFVTNADANVNFFFSDTIRLVNMFQKEYSDGYLSHYIFCSEMFQTTNTNRSASQVETTKDFLYFEDRQYKSIDECLTLFTASPGEWNIYGNMGLGEEMFAPATAINMLDCNVLDMAKMSATPLFKSMSTGGRDVAALRFWPGVGTDVGATEFLQNNLGANISQVVNAAIYLKNGIDRNMVDGGDDPSTPDRSQGSISPSEARGRDFKEFGVLKHVVAHFYTSFDKVIFRTFLKFLEAKENAPMYDYAKEWKTRCIEDGVPEELFSTTKKGLKGLPRQFRSVKATRVAGDGSTLARIMGLEAMNPIVPTMNPKQMNRWKAEWVEATMGIDYVKEFVSDNLEEEISGGASLARTEDNLMKLGQAPLFSPDNDQEAHGDEHMGTGTGIVNAVAQQQMSVVDAAKIMDLLIPHLTEHIQFMAKAPLFYKDILGKLEKPYKQLVQWAQLNKRNAEAQIQAAIRKQEEDQAKTQEVMDDAARKDFVAESDAARKDRSTEAANERASKANDTRAKIMEKKADADIRVKEKKADAVTVKDKSTEALESEAPEALHSELSSFLGSSPSTSDFE